MSHEDSDITDNHAQGPPRPTTKRVDVISAVAGVLFIAIATLVLVDRFWSDIDPVLVAGGTIIAVGVAMIVGRIRRGRHQRGSIDG